jgi:hypothetical protein
MRNKYFQRFADGARLANKAMRAGARPLRALVAALDHLLLASTAAALFPPCWSRS